MPYLFLSPSAQEFNPYVGGGNEEYYMNLIADAMIPYLVSSGIQFTRNDPNESAAAAIRLSNSGTYDLHLALHSNAAPDQLSGTLRGTDVYYYPSSIEGKRAANIIAENLKLIYPLPEKVDVLATTAIGEVSKTIAPSVFIEFAYHDNVDDANWIRNNITEIARNLVMSLTTYFGIPFVWPQDIRVGTVTTQGGSLNLRARPSLTAEIKGSIPNGAEVTVYSAIDGWYVVGYNYLVGYVSDEYITLS